MSKELRASMIVLTFAGLCLGCMGQSPFLAQSIRRIETHGGHVSDEWSPEVVWFRDCPPVPLTDDDLRTLMPTLRKFHHLEILDLTNTSITGASLPQIARLKTLQRVVLTATKVAPDDIPVLRTLPKLWYVTVPSERFTEQDVHELEKKMPGITIKREEDPCKAEKKDSEKVASTNGTSRSRK